MRATRLSFSNIYGSRCAFEKLSLVATASVRDARNQAEFRKRATAAVNVSVEVISGREEARLIHLGVITRWPDVGPAVLMIDIGGGSAEVISSHQGHISDAASKPIGAIRLREIFLQNDPPADRDIQRLRAYITERLDAVARRFGRGPWRRTVATSATAAAAICAVSRIP